MILKKFADMIKVGENGVREHDYPQPGIPEIHAAQQR
jgi:hypothetical protein